MSDPRKRPPDPAGTQPKVDPDSLRVRQPRGDTLALPVPADPAMLEPAALDVGALPTTAPQPAAHPASAHGARTNGQQASGHAHAPRFQFLFGALGALSVSAVALAIMLVRAPAPTPEQPWSAWKPVENSIDPAQQIAEHVGPQYRQDGRQIVQVTGGPPALKGQPLTVGVVKSGQAPAALEGNSVLYQLCGTGAECSIKRGKPSVERGLLLSREALELALYTFRYVSGVNQVIVTIPPTPPTGTKSSAGGSSTSGGSSGSSSGGAGSSGSGSGSSGSGSSGAGSGSSGSGGGPSAGKAKTAAVTTTSGASSSSDSTSSGLSVTSNLVAHHALLFSPQDVAGALERPLQETLSSATPRVSQMNTWPDAATVKALTEPRLYDFVISETQQTGPVMLLEPPGLGG